MRLRRWIREIFFAPSRTIAHIGARKSVGRQLLVEVQRSMIKDDIVALLPDLRAFSRFLCREREAADDLVQFHRLMLGIAF